MSHYKNIVILSVSFNEDNNLQQKRLKEDIEKTGYNGDYLFWTNQLPPNSPSHYLHPYGFKVFAFLAAKKAGYETAIWIDTRQRVVKNPQLLYNIIKYNGFYFESIGKIKLYCNEEAKKIANITEEELEEPMMCGHIIGLSLQHPTGIEFLENWEDMMHAGVFDGSRKNHRHDMIAGGLAISRLQLQYTNAFDCNGNVGILAGCHTGKELKKDIYNKIKNIKVEVIKKRRCRGCGKSKNKTEISIRRK